MKIEVECANCKKKVLKHPYRLRLFKKLFCSNSCRQEGQIGYTHTEKAKKRISTSLIGHTRNNGIRRTEEFKKKLSQYAKIHLPKYSFKQGIVPWNKNKIGVMPSESKHVSWRGSNVGYRALHRWVEKKRGKAFFCENCLLDKVPKDKKRYFQWANLSGHYLRILEDWKQLCYKCHKALDAGRQPQG